ncbi:hypothetical protein VMCG_10788 [Cytospora schulzeri]|uniref:Uncharacterized protein n=1 Tax=Cytospora schulzeri TaxID=448051 RepID=A0A423VA60_9PEZI|nr:hypothetical protein VMCG_10788 [Valsa malicola]
MDETLLQTKAKDDAAFTQGVISLEAEAYETLVKEFRLPFRCLESTSAVGPFFWWTKTEDCLQLIFRKSDVEWLGTSRGWEMMLSYSSSTGITSGYVKAMETAKFNTVLEELLLCGRPASHPLLLPVLVLCRELSSENDEKQRAQRKELRKLENALSSRYQVTPAARYGTETDLELDRISTQIANCQCEVLQKRPQAWQNVIRRAKEAANHFWHSLSKEKRDPALRELHDTLLNRLEFLTVKLEGIENYALVTLERLSIHREVLHNIINQRESRLNLEIAIQQHRLADTSGHENASMKTLTWLGSLFLPGTFVASLFSTPFFDFSSK